MSDIPAHRSGVTPRDGDTRVIGKGGKIVNVDAEAREKAARAASAAASKPAPAKAADKN